MTSPWRTRLTLAASAAGAGIVALDGTLLVLAQPSLRRDLGAGLAQVQWTSTGYLLAVAALLVIAGRLGDRHGHRRLLMAGALGLGGTSAALALAPDVGWVIALRVLQGVSGALLQPATLALLRVTYPADRLAAAVAVRTSVIGLSAAAGPVVGGVLVAQVGWRAVFAVNVPVAVVIAALALTVKEPPAARAAARPLGFTGPALLAATLAAGVHTVVGVPAHGWTGAATLLGLAVTAGAGAAFAAHQRRTAHPVVPAAVARSLPVAASMALLLAVTAGMFGALFVGTFLLQDVFGLSALESGLRVLPLTALMVVGAPIATTAVRRHGPRRTATAGTVLVASGVAGLSLLAPGASPLATGAAFGVLGAGFTAVMVTATGTVVGDAPPGYAGVVGGIKQTAMNVGPALGIAVAASVMPASPASGEAPVTGVTLAVLAGIAALGLVPASLLPSPQGAPTGSRSAPSTSGAPPRR
ncbi:MFS transporter [Nonomuraea sp. SMC257]|uniref:MFS transporter n=1 Tax=Nonomuraea montanisoli TaxID=2741721 RepID=A0A7Y6I7F3_9ACTN|nr:MFS transporter [Nonomuraea montanisoli]NUW33103.1 MFS transporter [Nonomuraea montanisoli]